MDDYGAMKRNALEAFYSALHYADPDPRSHGIRIHYDHDVKENYGPHYCQACRWMRLTDKQLSR